MTISPTNDWRKTNPRFVGDNFRRNLALVDEVRAIGAEIGATPAQTALAWLLTRGDDIAPIPGTRRVSRVEENTAADTVELTADQVQRLSTWSRRPVHVTTTPTWHPSTADLSVRGVSSEVSLADLTGDSPRRLPARTHGMVATNLLSGGDLVQELQYDRFRLRAVRARRLPRSSGRDPRAP